MPPALINKTPQVLYPLFAGHAGGTALAQPLRVLGAPRCAHRSRRARPAVGPGSRSDDALRALDAASLARTRPR